MRLQYLPANAAYVFTFGDQIIRMERTDRRFFATRAEAVAVAADHGLSVDSRGDVRACDPWADAPMTHGRYAATANDGGER